MTNLLNIGRTGLASKNRPHFRAGGLYPNDCHLFSPLSVADALVVRGLSPCSPLAGIEQGGMSSQYEHLPARFNKKPDFTNEQPRST